MAIPYNLLKNAGTLAASPPPLDAGAMVPPPAPLSPIAADLDAHLGQIQSQVGDVMSPSDMYLWKGLRMGSGTKEAREGFFSLGQNGVGPDEFYDAKAKEHAASTAEALATRTEGMDDAQFQGLLSHLQEQLSSPPQASADPQLKGPSTMQLAAGGLFALLAPKYASQALAAPFQSQLQQHDVDLQRTRYDDADRYRRWKDQIDGTQTEIGIVERRQGRLDGIQARKDLATQNAADRKTLADANNKARADLEADRLAGRVRLANLSTDAKATLARMIHGDKEASEAAKLVAKAAPEARATLAESFRRSHTGIFSTLDDDAIAALGEARPDEELKGAQTDLTVAKTKTENETRQSKVNNLIKTGRLTDARTEATKANEELADIRAKYLPDQMRAQIDRTNAEADRARKAANDTYAGINGRGRAGADAWTKLGLKLDDAEAKTRAKLAGLSPQKEAIERAIRELNTRIIAAEGDENVKDSARGAMRNERSKLQLSLGKIGAVYAESTSYLDRVKAQKATVETSLRQAAEREAAAAMPVGGPLAPGQIGSLPRLPRSADGPQGGTLPALPSGWTIKPSGKKP